MDTTQSTPALRALYWGLFLLVISGIILYYAGDISENDFGNHDPGPRALPQSLGLILLFGACCEIISGGRHWLVERNRIPETAGPSIDWKRTIAVLLSLVVYRVLLTNIGFVPSTMLFGVSVQLILGTSWWLALLSSAGIVAIVHTLFVRLFQVPLP